ncbi:DUF3892 domain-containing protein [Brachybacterium muris]|uniref:DUF3892 domain-containing protein n=1 Tax=Brachybacterium muris TaxID=219301 RepID=UPI00223BB1A2|nr:DUF3892 domain-containing protein [Brachybacterium muris]MCT1654338.1 DUF3892 domain-containing protein [Brachybacterium muris]
MSTGASPVIFREEDDMALQVTRSGKDRDGDITSLCGNGWSHPKAQAVAAIRNDSSAYYVSVGGQTAYVRVGTRNGKDYLTTSRDGYSANNLDNLPDC